MVGTWRYRVLQGKATRSGSSEDTAAPCPYQGTPKDTAAPMPLQGSVRKFDLLGPAAARYPRDMKTPQITLIAIVALGLPLHAFAQKAANNTETEQAIMKAEHDMSTALTKADAATADTMIASDAYFVSPDGSSQTKA